MKLTRTGYGLFIGSLLLSLCVLATAVQAAVTPRVACGESHTAAVRGDGTLWTWGDNLGGRLGDDSTGSRSAPVQIGTDSNWKNVAVARNRTLALKADGTLWDLLGDGSTPRTPARIGPDADWKTVSAGQFHTVALKQDGSLWAWGNNNYYQLGDGTNTYRETPTLISASYDWVTVAAGSHHTLALKMDGSLWGWGYNNDGVLGIEGTEYEYVTVPTRIGTTADWSKIAPNGSSLAVKKNGTLWAWGSVLTPKGDGTYYSSNVPIQVDSGAGWVDVAAGRGHYLARKSDGSVWGWGSNDYGQLGAGNNRLPTTLVRVGAASDWQSIAAGGEHSAAVKTDGTFWSWGHNHVGQLGYGKDATKYIPTRIGTATIWANVAASQYTSFAISNGALWGWGYNAWHLGNGALEGKTTPVRIGTSNLWSTVAVGLEFTVGLQMNGTLWIWGRPNNPGNDNPAADYSRPVQTAFGHTWQSVAAGSSHVVAVASDGSLWAWGANAYGQLGDGTTIDRELPTRIGTASNWSKVFANGAYNLALKSDGSLWGWGQNNHGQLGTGATSDSLVPIRINGTSLWKSIATCYNHTLGVRKDGSLWQWGDWYGAVSPPTRIGSDTDWEKVATGIGFGMALKTDGTNIWTWGGNTDGQLGVGKEVLGTELPVRAVESGSHGLWSEISAGDGHALAVTTDGTLWAWGANQEGQVGDGTAWKQSPVAVAYPTKHKLTVIKEGSGTGSVTATTDTLHWNELADTAIYPENTLVTLRATPASGSAFAGWSGACAGTSLCKVTMHAAKSVTATFNLKAFPPPSLTVPLTNAFGSYTVTWEPSTTADVTYLLEEATDSAFSANRRTAYSGTALKATISGRLNGKTYYYRIKATRAGYAVSAWKTAANGCKVQYFCDPPATIYVPQTDADGAYTVTWSASTTPGVTYTLTEATNSTFTAGLRTVTYGGTALKANITGRSKGVIYFYRVSAYLSGVGRSPHKTAANGCAIPCAAPAVLTVPASDADGTYTVTWYNSQTSGVTYTLQEATDSAFTTGVRNIATGAGTNADITGRTKGKTYFYRVKASKAGVPDSPWKVGGTGCRVGL